MFLKFRPVGQESAEEPPVQDFTEFKPYESTVPAGPTPPIPPSIRALHSLAMPDDLWRFYRGLALECNRQMNPSDQRHKVGDKSQQASLSNAAILRSSVWN